MTTKRKEYNKLKKLFIGLPPEQLSLIDELIKTTAFNIVEMEKAMLMVEQDGSIILFKNGTQEFLKKHPAFDVYISLQTKHMTSLKELKNYIPSIGGEINVHATNTINAMTDNIRERKLKMVK